MLNYRTLITLGAVAALSLATVPAAHGDTLKQVTSSSAQGANDSLAWSQKGADGTVLAASFSATTAKANSVTVSMGAANSIIYVVCTATPSCSWTGTGFNAGDSLLWSSDAGNGGSGPVTINFAHNVSGAGALIQADLPGGFTGQIQVYNGNTLLASYTASSNTAGDPVYLGAIDQTGANISSVVFSLTSCASLCTDFGLDTVNVNSGADPALTSPTPGSVTPLSGSTAFTWNPGSGSSEFELRIGTTGAGSHDIFLRDVPSTVTSETVAIPANGATLYVRLFYKMNGVWGYKDYTFTEAQSPILTSPTSSPLSGATTFAWNPGTNSTNFELRIGTTGAGSHDIYLRDLPSTVTSETVAIPTNGATLYVRLFYKMNGVWAYKDYTFTEALAPALTSPSSSPVSGAITFAWNPGTGSTEFELRIGTTGAGSHNIYLKDVASTVTSEQITIPANGVTIYVRLFYKMNGVWHYKDYTFTEGT